MKNSLPIIFIVGSSRSGTTMFNRVLANHTDILGLNELHFIGRKWDIGSGTMWTYEKGVQEGASLFATARRSLWDEMPTETEVEIARTLIPVSSQEGVSPSDVFSGVLDYLLREAEKIIATDQTPRNILYVDQILDVFPNAKVIQLIRDPRAVLYSQKNRWRQRGLGAKNTPVWNAIRVFVNFHAYTVSKLWCVAYRKGKAAAGHRNYMALRFEDLVNAPESTLKQVCDFLSISFDVTMLDVPRVGSSNLEHREDVRGISSDVVREWEGKLSRAELWVCQWLSGRAMNDLGYKPLEICVPWFGLGWQLLIYPFHILGMLLMNPHLVVRVAKAIKK